MFFFTCYGVVSAVKNIKIERRIPNTRNLSFNTPIQNTRPIARPATEQELYDAGWIVREIQKDGLTCIEKKGEIVKCFEDVGLIN